jgi:hypothetical protein
MKTIYHIFTDNNSDDMIVYLRDENNIPVMIWNFYANSDYAHIHSLYEMEDPTNEEEPLQKGSIIRKVKLNGDYNLETLKSNLETNWDTTDDFDILSLREDDVISNVLDDEAFYRRTKILDELIG